jgi:hypothetical protein
MATAGTEMSMSLDGFIADPSGEVGPLFAWYGTGAVTVPTPDPRWTVRTSEASARHLRDGFTRIGALVAGRRWFDAARGWGGNHPMGEPVFVVSHTISRGHRLPGGTAWWNVRKAHLRGRARACALAIMTGAAVERVATLRADGLANAGNHAERRCHRPATGRRRTDHSPRHPQPPR